MKKDLGIFEVVCAVGCALIFTAIGGALFGGLSAWFAGLFFGKSILGALAQLGLELNMWQLGVTLGFLGGWLKGPPIELQFVKILEAFMKTRRKGKKAKSGAVDSLIIEARNKTQHYKHKFD